MKNYILIGLALLVADVTLACSIAPPTAKLLNSSFFRSTIITSPNEHFFLKLVPSRWKNTGSNGSKPIRKKDSYAIAFTMLADGQLKQLWSFKSWDVDDGAYWKIKRPDFYLSDDGKNLVEINSVRSSKDKKAVIFYREGEKIKSYAPSDFGVDELRVGPTSCRMLSWLERDENRKPLHGFLPLKIRTVNDVLWNISLETLSVVKAK